MPDSTPPVMDLQIDALDPLAALQSVEDVLAAIEQSMRPGALPLSGSAASTVASRRAGANFLANQRALATRQADVVALLEHIWLPSLQWMLGRDGSLTARDGNGKWVGGTSLPLRVARGLLCKMEPVGATICLLAPNTAQQIVAALERLSPSRALIAVIPDENAALVMLHAHDFSTEISSARLWLACGMAWEQRLACILADHPGLCVPQQYIRTSLLDEVTLQTMVQAGNRAFAGETARRAAIVQQKFAAPVASVPPLACVIGRSTFAYENLSSLMLWQVIKGNDRFEPLDVDQPLCASPLALAQAAEHSQWIVAADFYRADLPGVVASGRPWVTWVTTPRIALPVAGAKQDRLILADASWKEAAVRLGWKTSQVTVAAWPALWVKGCEGEDQTLSFLADAQLELKPEHLTGFSSHALLWEAVANELMDNPLLLVRHEQDYLSSRVRQLNIDPGQIDLARFGRELVIPAYRQGVARLLHRAGLPLAVYGRGWDLQPELALCIRTAPATLESLGDIARTTGAVICPEPGRAAHAVQILGKSVVYASASKEVFVREARAALGQTRQSSPISAMPLNVQALLSVLKQTLQPA